MTDSYARIKTEEAKRLAEATAKVIQTERTQYLHKMTLREANRHNWWTWLPWVKTWNLEETKFRLAGKGRYYCHWHWTAHNRANAILNLVKAAGSDPYIYITSEDYQYIQHGADYVRLSAD